MPRGCSIYLNIPGRRERHLFQTPPIEKKKFQPPPPEFTSIKYPTTTRKKNHKNNFLYRNTQSLENSSELSSRKWSYLHL
jgi:hypothetical protein